MAGLVLLKVVGAEFQGSDLDLIAAAAPFVAGAEDVPELVEAGFLDGGGEGGGGGLLVSGGGEFPRKAPGSTFEIAGPKMPTLPWLFPLAPLSFGLQ